MHAGWAAGRPSVGGWVGRAIHPNPRVTNPALEQTQPPHPTPPRPGYVAVTDEASGRALPTAFLNQLKEDFVGK
jgi:hypothetical protein